MREKHRIKLEAVSSSKRFEAKQETLYRELDIARFLLLVTVRSDYV